MLSEREYKQIKTAIEAAWGLDMVGYGDCMPKQNVLAILANYLEEDRVGETIEEKDL